MLKINFSKPILGILSLAFISVFFFAAYNIYYVFPSFLELSAENNEDETEDIARHFNAKLASMGILFEKASITDAVKQESNLLKENFMLWRIRLISPDGQIVFSSEPAEVGQKIQGKFFYSLVARGYAYKSFIPKNRLTPSSGFAPTDLVLAYVPLMQKGKFAGASEVYANVSGSMKKIDSLLLKSFVTLVLLASGLLSAIVIVSLKANRFMGAKQRADEIIERSLREKETLLRELYHRTKNNMQVISSLTSLQSASVSDRRVLQMFDDTRNRIRAMALVHEKLYQSQDLSNVNMSEYIRDLANAVLGSNAGAGRNVALKIEAESVHLPIDVIMPCGLIITELITNSIKYAFAGGKKGEIRISFRQADPGYMELIYGDDGPGLPTANLKDISTLGLKLVYNLATKQLGGNIQLEPGSKSEFRITFKIQL